MKQQSSNSLLFDLSDEREREGEIERLRKFDNWLFIPLAIICSGVTAAVGPFQRLLLQSRIQKWMCLFLSCFFDRALIIIIANKESIPSSVCVCEWILVAPKRVREEHRVSIYRYTLVAAPSSLHTQWEREKEKRRINFGIFKRFRA